VLTAVDDVHHGDGDVLGGDAADVTVQREIDRRGRRLGAGQGNPEDGVGPQDRFILRAVQGDHGIIDGPLFQTVHADDFRSDLVDDVLYGLFDALAEVALLVSVPQFQHLMLPRRGAGGNGSAAGDSGKKGDFRFDGGIAPGVQDLTGIDFDDLGHKKTS